MASLQLPPGRRPPGSVSSDDEDDNDERWPWSATTGRRWRPPGHGRCAAVVALAALLLALFAGNNAGADNLIVVGIKATGRLIENTSCPIRCTGTMLTNVMVLTAASCAESAELYEPDPQNTTAADAGNSTTAAAGTNPVSTTGTTPVSTAGTTPVSTAGTTPKSTTHNARKSYGFEEESAEDLDDNDVEYNVRTPSAGRNDDELKLGDIKVHLLYAVIKPLFFSSSEPRHVKSVSTN